MNDMARALMIAGLVLLAVGVSLYFFPKIPGMGRLPGDILIKKDNTTFHFPITTCILISLFLSFILFLWNQKH